MNENRWYFLLNLVGGIAVLGGYLLCIEAHAGQNDRLWGEVPEAVRGAYTACMFPAAAGYLVAFAYWVRADWSTLRFRSGPAFRQVMILHAVFLVTAALWMPVTWWALDHQMQSLLWPIQGLLAVTGLSSLAFPVALRALVDPPNARFHLVAQCSLAFLVFQCLVLDALIWPRFFTITAV